MMRHTLLLLPVLVAVPLARGGEPPRIVRHVRVYNEKGRFVGWPANHGAWSWGDEFLVAFSRGFFREGSPDDYHLDRTKPEDFLFARSRDGGDTWTIETPRPPGTLRGTRGQRHAAMPPGLEEDRPADFQGRLDFSNPDFALFVRGAERGRSAPCKGVGLQWVQLPPGNWFAPAGSSRSGGGGNEAVEAFDVKDRSGGPASRQAVTQVNIR